MLNRRRTGALLILCGYLGVIGGSVAWIVSYWHFGFHPEMTTYQAALAIGMGLAGLACWRWTVFARASGASSTLVRGPTRLMAAAS